MLPTAADEPLAAAVFIFLVYGACFLLYVVVPGPIISGYARDARGKPLRYKLNSLRVFLITIFLTCCTSYGSVFPFTLPILQRMNCCLSTCVVGLSVSFVCYLKGPFKQHVSAHPTPAPEDVSVFKDPAQAGRMFFLGWELNPRFGLIDFKMYLYLAGAVMLQVNVLSGLAYHYSTNNNLSWPLIVYCCELSWFLLDYVYHEHVQLYTYDLFAENVGFKLAWGCLCFYPYFYSIGLPVLTEGKQGDVPAFALGTSAVLFVIGYILSRGANNQKYSFKVDPQAKFLGFLEQKSIGGKLIVSGFWGLSRHINYLGEVLMAVGLAIPGGWINGSVLPWLYPIYYIVLLITRERDDYARCEQKYGQLWNEYVTQVQWRIVPYIY